MNTKEFYKIPKDLMQCTGFVSKVDGSFVTLTPTSKFVYAYMLARTEFFTEKLKGQHYESQNTIAKACGIDVKTAGRMLRMFVDHGVIQGKKLRPKGEGQWRWFYDNVSSDIILWSGDVDKPEIVEHTSATVVEDDFDHTFWQDYQEQPVEDLNTDLIEYFGGVQ